MYINKKASNKIVTLMKEGYSAPYKFAMQIAEDASFVSMTNKKRQTKSPAFKQGINILNSPLGG